MKKVFLFLLLVRSVAYAQSNCTVAMPVVEFNQNYNTVLHQQNDKMKYNLCVKLIHDKCLLSSQVKQLASLFNTDGFRLRFALEAYTHTLDKKNFYDVYDSFKAFSAAFKLHDFVMGFNQLYPPIGQEMSVPEPPCVVTASDFEQCKASINKESFDNTKLVMTKQILAAKKCFTCSQVKEIVNLFSFESGKLEIAKYAYDYTIDRDNYYTIADAFSFAASKEDLMNFIQSKH